MDGAGTYPVRVDAALEWVLVIPHYIVLMFLWLAFVVLSLMTDSYPPFRLEMGGKEEVVSDDRAA